MKRLPIVLSTLVALALLIATPALAQHTQHHQQARGQAAQADTMPGMMQGMMSQHMMGQGMTQMMRGMHQQMMQNPMHRTNMMAFALPALADTLELSDEQRQQLDALKSELTSRLESSQEQMATRREAFMGLFEEGDRPSADRVRQHLEEMARLRVDRQALLFETAQEMREVLTGEQRQMLEGMTPQERMHQMMANMSMMDMMRMMQSLRGSMMGSTVMQGGMMQGGMHPNRPMHQNPQNQ